MKTTILLGLVAFLASIGSASAAVVSNAAFDVGAIHAGGDNGGTDYYGSGNDDAFAEYGIASFNFSAVDFGGAVTGINSMTYTLTFNDRTFSDGSSFELYFSTDDFDDSYTGLTYDNSGASDPNGLDASQFSNLTSLGSYALGFDPTDGANGGLQFNYNLNFAGVEGDLLSEINAGSAIQLILVAENLADDITFSGLGNNFDPGDPTLAIDATVVPEPSAGLLFALGIGGVLTRRRRS